MLQGQVRTKSIAGHLIADLAVLFKVRIVLLLLLSAVAAAMIASRGHPSAASLGLLMLAGGTTAAGASALNEYLERDRDALMRRTQRRPLVQGTLPAPVLVPYVAAAMILLPPLLIMRGNPALACFLLAGAATYVGVYTIWLKPRTPANIVIGGAAGSFAVLSGGAAVHAWTDPGVLLLAALLFFWTPIHFWALALVYREDYARAGVPMLPVVSGARTSALWGLLHGLAAGAAGIALAFHPAMGLVYLVPACLATTALIWQGVRLVIVPAKRRAWTLFHTSNLYLAAILLAACLAAALKIPGVR
jgi:protoheme IX farnesyltransferase